MKTEGGESARRELVAVGADGGSVGGGPVGGGLIGNEFVGGGFIGEKEFIVKGNEGVVGGQWPAGGTPLRISWLLKEAGGSMEQGSGWSVSQDVLAVK